MAPHRSPSSTHINRLSIIDEDAPNDGQGTQLRASHRPWDRRFRDPPPRPSSDTSPPEYMLGDIGKSKAEALRRLRDNRQIARRGGWRRLTLIFLVVLIVLIALGVGLGVGLTRNRNSSNNDNGSPDASPDSQEPFPAGAYLISTYLTTTKTDCTAQASTWRCFPYMTYSPSSAPASNVNFTWIINATQPSSTASGSPASSSAPATYMISSSDNPFAITFDNVSLTLVDAGKSTERYSFSLPIDKYVVPSGSITADNGAAACWFNATRFEGSLYTRMPSGGGADGSSSAPPAPAPTNGWQPWPYAVNVTQHIAGGTDVPNCYRLMNGVLGAPVTDGFGSRPASDECECGWRNFEL